MKRSPAVDVVVLMASLLGGACTRGDPKGAVVAVAPVEKASDRDGDGVIDSDDACPDVPEDVDEFEDEDGCVDPDNDGDGILDAAEYIDGRWTNCDWGMRSDEKEMDCRNLPEDVDGREDVDGCPDVIDCDHAQPYVTILYDRAGRAAELEVAVDSVAELLLTDLHRIVWIDAFLDMKVGERELALARALVERIDAHLRARGIEPARIQHGSRRRTKDSGPAAAAVREQYSRIDLGVDNPLCECAWTCRYTVVCR